MQQARCAATHLDRQSPAICISSSRSCMTGRQEERTESRLAQDLVSEQAACWLPGRDSGGHRQGAPAAAATKALFTDGIQPCPYHSSNLALACSHVTHLLQNFLQAGGRMKCNTQRWSRKQKHAPAHTASVPSRPSSQSPAVGNSLPARAPTLILPTRATVLSSLFCISYSCSRSGRATDRRMRASTAGAGGRGMCVPVLGAGRGAWLGWVPASRQHCGAWELQQAQQMFGQ
jgi:hypothetical protein